MFGVTPGEEGRDGGVWCRTQRPTRTRLTAPADSLIDVWSDAARSLTLAQQVVLKQYSMGLARLEYQFNARLTVSLELRLW